jgi:hypothetical protein
MLALLDVVLVTFGVWFEGDSPVLPSIEVLTPR